MAAVVRLKRRLDEEPLEALVLACKRKKTEEDAAAKDETPITAILKFAGTVKNQEEDVTAHINKSLQKRSLKHVADISGKIREETKRLSQQNRFKVVNCFRALNESDVAEPEAGLPGEKKDEKLLTVFDVVSQLEDEDKKSDSEDSKQQDEMLAEGDYVYDLYYTNMTGSDGLVSLDDLVGVHPYNHSEWDLRDSGGDSDESIPGADDEDDSNDENNWRNDYPDSDHSIDEDDMRMAMQDMNIEDDLSSDDAADDFIFGVTVDPSQVELFGEGYASYKARVLNELEGDEEGAYSRDDAEDEDPVLRFM